MRMPRVHGRPPPELAADQLWRFKLAVAGVDVAGVPGLTAAVFFLRVSAALRPAARRLRVSAALAPAARCLRVFAALAAAARRFRVAAAFSAGVMRPPRS